MYNPILYNALRFFMTHFEREMSFCPCSKGLSSVCHDLIVISLTVQYNVSKKPMTSLFKGEVHEIIYTDLNQRLIKYKDKCINLTRQNEIIINVICLDLIGQI